MKSLKIITATVLLSAATATAQTETTGKATSFGVKGGVNFASVSGDDFDSPDSRTSFHVGLLAEFPMTDMFSVQAEALYSGQGFESDIDGVDGDKVEYQLDYINVPVLAKIYLTSGLSIEAGPQFSFKVNEEIDADPGDDPGDLDLDEAKDFDFGLAAGLTFQTNGGFFASGRYIYGMTDIIEDVDVRNSVFQLGVGFKF